MLIDDDWDDWDAEFDWCDGCPFDDDPWECACCAFVKPDVDPWDI